MQISPIPTLSEEINDIHPKTSIAYHAGMSKKLREMLQLQFSSGKKNIIVSTIAFGMGISFGINFTFSTNFS